MQKTYLSMYDRVVSRLMADVPCHPSEKEMPHETYLRTALTEAGVTVKQSLWIHLQKTTHPAHAGDLKYSGLRRAGLLVPTLVACM